MKDIGDGYSTPAVVGDRLYLLSNKGMDERVRPGAGGQGRQGDLVHAPRQGRQPRPGAALPRRRSTPTVDGELLYALGSDGDLACLETATGKVRWQKNLRTDFGGKPGKWAYSESPLVDGDAGRLHARRRARPRWWR